MTTTQASAEFRLRQTAEVSETLVVEAYRELTLIERIWLHRHFYLFISPFFLLFVSIVLYPIVDSLYLSLTSWDGLGVPRFVGLSNFKTLFQDRLFFASLLNTLVIGAIYMLPMLTIGFVMAMILNGPVQRLRTLFRAAVFLPSIAPMVVVATVFQLLYGGEYGLINVALRAVGFAGVPWLSQATWARLSVSLLLIWRWSGYNMVLMLAGLQGIPGELYESARIDGAGGWRRIWHITVPLLRPTLVFCTIMSVVGTIYMFDEVFVLTQGGPGNATTNFGLYLFNQAFSDFRFGYASAAAYTVAVTVFLFSIVGFSFGRRRTA